MVCPDEPWQRIVSARGPRRARRTPLGFDVTPPVMSSNAGDPIALAGAAKTPHHQDFPQSAEHSETCTTTELHHALQGNPSEKLGGSVGEVCLVCCYDLEQ